MRSPAFAQVVSLLALLGWSSHARCEDAVPYGVWEVTQVLVDLQDQLHWDYPPDDPLHMGRRLIIDRDGFRLDYPELACKQPVWRKRSTTWRTVFAKAFRTRTDAGVQVAPLPRDYDLRVAPSAAVSVFSVCSSKGHSSYLADNWFALLKDGRLALHVDPQGLLLLTRRSPDQKPVASFPCDQAESASEKAICSDIDLAAWDRSMDAAYARAERKASNPLELSQSQEEWLAERDACGADKVCLEWQLFSRTTSLVYFP